ncbi:glutathione peroxidase [Xenophilus sp. Marseille-Q4582]|uniref:glutathione peroxidase n=1 Tax=Xenophilus sp. Marseille-Q4582 TaxID=2866600 RepID=UPI001CE3DC9B|nr:glutathione peroxidase [Xenophilus sp. Marseille-Q4582]
MRLAPCLLLAAGLGVLAGPAGAAGPARADATAAAPAPGCPALLDKRFDRLQDEKPQDLCQYAGRVLLVVNTASFCGFTKQYAGLESLERRYRARGFTVLGFPSNDFAQEKGSNAEIAEFCESTFGVQFPMFVKSAVRGSDANPLFRELAQQSGTTPKWNFYKYLVGRDGRVVQAFSSMTAPDDAQLVQALERELAKPPL